jgi:hypothetical protein
MLSVDEKKQLRVQFWNRFEAYASKARMRKGKPKHFILNNTGIRQLKLKLHFDEEQASVGIDIETRNLDKRIALFAKLEELEPFISKALGTGTQWNLEILLPTGKSISRIAIVLPGVSIYHPNDWAAVIPFFYKKMSALEDFFLEFRDLLKT